MPEYLVSYNAGPLFSPGDIVIVSGTPLASKDLPTVREEIKAKIQERHSVIVLFVAITSIFELADGKEEKDV